MTQMSHEAQKAKRLAKKGADLAFADVEGLTYATDAF